MIHFYEIAVLYLDSHSRHQIQSHAADCYPQECCGLLLGRMVEVNGNLQKKLYGLHCTHNVWDQSSPEWSRETPVSSQVPTATRRYWIAPDDLFTAQKYARTQGWDIIGVYHSHPDHEAVPSECDRKWAWPQYSYVIVAVKNGVPHDFRSWMLDDQQQFQPEAVLVSAPLVASTPETDF